MGEVKSLTKSKGLMNSSNYIKGRLFGQRVYFSQCSCYRESLSNDTSNDKFLWCVNYFVDFLQIYRSLHWPCNDKAESAGVKPNLWYLESKALFTQCTLVVHLGWPAQVYHDACGLCFLLTNFARSMQSGVGVLAREPTVASFPQLSLGSLETMLATTLCLDPIWTFIR